MNTSQKLTRIAGVALLILMALVPPWKLSYEVADEKGNTTAGSIFSGYHPLWGPPSEGMPEAYSKGRYHIDLVRLGLQFVGVLVVVNAGIFIGSTLARGERS